MVKNNFIFLAGHHRSGTSLLHEILKNHPGISGFSDTGVPEDEGQHLQSVYRTAKTNGGPGKYIFNQESKMDENHSLANDSSSEKIMKQWSKYLDSNCEYFIEKSPPNLIRTRFLQKIFPNSKFVVILRHPLAVSFATQKWSKTSIKSLMDHTLLGYEILEKDIPFLDNVYVLKYEDFVLNPQSEIDKVYEFLGLKSLLITHNINPDVNNKYFSIWESYRKNPIKRPFFSFSKKLENRSKKFGYSLKDIRALYGSEILGVHTKN